MDSLRLNIDYDDRTKTLYLYGSSITIHCHHYISNLLKMIDSSPYVDGGSIMYDAAEKVTIKHIGRVFEKNNITATDEKYAAAEEFFGKLGFGRLKFDIINGEVKGASSSVGFIPKSWTLKYGERPDHICYFTAGYIAGVIEVINNAPQSSYEVSETACIASGSPECVFVVRSPI
ncbi:hypothetical protein CUJ83_04445 [Methanocella sp. CWC-04]|uniref:4-vinyl reductase 4VR domain-containing protein n=1 Tax=Methanooceanicella nereidis TaxID=2052831 RepID=A0AAP2RCR5_9EURY|nr:hypothetical protein [Methanocella sp. CWC-04]MCD1294245.1 hypothetical protein [Methanocella sp. CWC-04]